MLSVTLSKENRVNFRYGQWSWNLEVTDQQRENLTLHMLRLGAKWSFHGSTSLLMMRYTPTDFEPMNDENFYCSCVDPSWSGTEGNWVCDRCGLPHE